MRVAKLWKTHRHVRDLRMAVRHGNVSRVAEILRHPLPINSRWNWLFGMGIHPLVTASYCGYIEIVELLLQLEPPARSVTLAESLESAAEQGHVPVVELLLERAAPLRRSLAYAAIGGHLDIMQLLIQRGASASEALSSGRISLWRLPGSSLRYLRSVGTPLPDDIIEMLDD